MRYKHLIFLLFISLGSSIFAQLSKTHYIPPLTSSDGFSDQYIYISTPKNSNVSYKITAIGQPDLAQYSGVVSNGSPVEQAVLDNSIEKKLAKLDGVLSAQVDFEKELARVEFDADKINKEVLLNTVASVNNAFSVHDMKISDQPFSVEKK